MSSLEKLKEDIRILNEDLVVYTKELASSTVQASKELKEKLEVKIRNTKRIVEDLNEEVRAKTRDLACKADDQVRDKPYHAAGTALLAGLVLGFLFGRKK